jgi:hypothetical protein
LKIETTPEAVVVAERSWPLSVGDLLEEFGPWMEVEVTNITTKVTAKASGFGNTATCLWENADN